MTAHPILDTSNAELAAILEQASKAATTFADLAPADRALQLAAVADALDAAADELVPLAMSESHLAEGRLRGELKRTTFQLRSFGDVLNDGSYLQATVDSADPGFALGPKPDLRRMLFPLGPVLVFAASNFPFAFSVAGGDTASALAAGCPVVLKAHPGHPKLSARTGEIVTAALTGSGAPAGTFAVIHGLDAGTTALRDERIKAAAFTGSAAGGRALYDIASSRPAPIPFFGELGSLNPVFVTPGAARARGSEIAQGYAASFAGHAGQLCTKPGLLFLPDDHGLEDALAAASNQVEAHEMLNSRLYEGYVQRRSDIAAVPGVQVLTEGAVSDGAAAPTLLTTDVKTLLAQQETLLEEAFGSLSIVVTYASEDDLTRAADAIGGNLTATVHAEADEAELSARLLSQLQERAGRLLFNGWPTGVAVSPAMQHGGPYPATTDTRFTSVGTSAIDRFLRPVTYQNMPQDLLPKALQDDNPWTIPQRRY